MPTKELFNPDLQRCLVLYIPSYHTQQMSILLSVMTWEPSLSHSRMRVSKDGFSVTSDNPSYFNSSRSGFALLPGHIYYFEVSLELRGGLEVKVGVTQAQVLENETGFSGTKKGWSFYAGQGGQKRHHANAGNYPYGKLLGREAIIGVLVDMKEGRLGFVIDGEWCGFAFTEPEFVCAEPVYAAFSLLAPNNTCTFLKQHSSWSFTRSFLYLRKHAAFLRRLPDGLSREVCAYLVPGALPLPRSLLLDLQGQPTDPSSSQE